MDFTVNYFLDAEDDDNDEEEKTVFKPNLFSS